MSRPRADLFSAATIYQTTAAPKGLLWKQTIKKAAVPAKEYDGLISTTKPRHTIDFQNSKDRNACCRLVPYAGTYQTIRFTGRFSDLRKWPKEPFPSRWTVVQTSFGSAGLFRQFTLTVARPSRIFTAFPFTCKSLNIFQRAIIQRQ